MPTAPSPCAMRPSDLFEFLVSVIPTGRPVFIWGEPGIGKSQIAAQAAKHLGRKLLDVRCVTLDAVDIRGVPEIRQGVAHWCPPSFLPREENTIVFLDELPQSEQMVQAALLQPILDGKIGEHVFPKGTVFLAAGNRQSDRAGAQRLITPLLNRMTHVDLVCDAKDWLAWASKADSEMHPLVTGFIGYRGELLLKFDPNNDERAWPTPRAWEGVSTIMKGNLPERLLNAAVAGTVGATASQEFLGFLRVFSRLPDKKSIIDYPDTAMVPTEASMIWALAVALCGWFGEKVAGELEPLVKYSLRLGMEKQVFVMQQAARHWKGQLLKVPAAKAWVSKNAKLLSMAASGAA